MLPRTDSAPCQPSAWLFPPSRQLQSNVDRVDQQTEPSFWSGLQLAPASWVPWTARRSNQSILKEINPEYSLEELMLKLPYFGHWKSQFIGKDSDAGKDWQENGGDRRCDGWMASPTQWTWVWASSRRWWRIGKTGMPQPLGLKRVGHDRATEQQQPASHGWRPLAWSDIPGCWALPCPAWDPAVLEARGPQGSRHHQPSFQMSSRPMGWALLPCIPLCHLMTQCYAQSRQDLSWAPPSPPYFLLDKQLISQHSLLLTESDLCVSPDTPRPRTVGAGGDQFLSCSHWPQTLLPHPLFHTCSAITCQPCVAKASPKVPKSFWDLTVSAQKKLKKNPQSFLSLEPLVILFLLPRTSSEHKVPTQTFFF